MLADTGFELAVRAALGLGFSGLGGERNGYGKGKAGMGFNESACCLHRCAVTWLGINFCTF